MVCLYGYFNVFDEFGLLSLKYYYFSNLKKI